MLPNVTKSGNTASFIIFYTLFNFYIICRFDSLSYYSIELKPHKRQPLIISLCKLCLLEINFIETKRNETKRC